MKPYFYNDMLILIGTKVFTQRRKEGVDNMLQWFLDQGVEGWEAKWRCQIGWNHEHLSKRDARKRITEVREAVRERFPKLLKRFNVVWTESDEREQPVNLSFYIDKEALKVAYDARLEVIK